MNRTTIEYERVFREKIRQGQIMVRKAQQEEETLIGLRLIREREIAIVLKRSTTVEIRRLLPTRTCNQEFGIPDTTPNWIFDVEDLMLLSNQGGHYHPFLPSPPTFSFS